MIDEGPPVVAREEIDTKINMLRITYLFTPIAHLPLACLLACLLASADRRDTPRPGRYPVDQFVAGLSMSQNATVMHTLGATMYRQVKQKLEPQSRSASSFVCGVREPLKCSSTDSFSAKDAGGTLGAMLLASASASIFESISIFPSAKSASALFC